MKKNFWRTRRAIGNLKICLLEQKRKEKKKWRITFGKSTRMQYKNKRKYKRHKISVQDPIAEQ